jgi:predicted component of type VI protein secretion system
MMVELRIAGPGLDVVRSLETGQPELVLGRDADCGVRLPDPQRNVSRRHLSLWIEDERLHYRVLSVVNGVEMPCGEVPPGASGVLPPGQTLKLGDYSICAVGTAPATAPMSGADPWAVLEREGHIAAPPQPAPATGTEDDPFGDWGLGFGTTFGPDGAGGGPLEAGGLAPGDISSFFQGLGLDPAEVGALTHGELQAAGRLVRILLLGVLDLHASASGLKQELLAQDRTTAATGQSNPLKSDLPERSKLRYLFGGRTAGMGLANPERAVRELLVDLIAHNAASAAAARSALESTLNEFAPATLKARLRPGGGGLFEGLRAWDAYCRHFEHEARDMGQWTQRLLDRHFAEAYLREIQRIRRDTSSRQR